MSNTIIGCGSGRCGTMSLAFLIDNCEGWTCTHEKEPFLGWEMKKSNLKRRVDFFKSRAQVGDVASDYLPHVDYFFRVLSDLKVACLKRNKPDTVKSWFAKTYFYQPPRNFWVRSNNFWTRDPQADRRFPTFDLAYDGSQPKDEFLKDVIQKYWTFYYEQAEELSERYPKFRIFSTSVLNKKEKQEKLFDFLEIENPNFDVGVTKNKLINDEDRNTKQNEKRLERYRAD